MTEELPGLLVANEMTLRELARRVGVDPAHLSRLLNGKRTSPTGSLAGRVATALALPEDYFPEFRRGAVIAWIDRDPSTRDRLYTAARRASE